MAKTKIITTEDVLIMLCTSVSKILSNATGSTVSYSPMVQKINRTCLRPDIGCFVLFDGGFAGLVIINFSAAAAMELYRGYMLNMGLPEKDLATQHTSDDVGNMLGELMNQLLGDFTGHVGKKLLISLNQSQPKMLAINKELLVSIDTNLDRPQARRVSFNTQAGNVFYLELATDKTEFMQLHEFEHDDFDPDELVASHSGSPSKADFSSPTMSSAVDDHKKLMDELGI